MISVARFVQNLGCRWNAFLESHMSQDLLRNPRIYGCPCYIRDQLYSFFFREQEINCSWNSHSRRICIACPTNQPWSCDKEATCSCKGIRGSIWKPNFSAKICCDSCKEDHTEEKEKILKLHCATWS
ncbi:hypothetical protein BRADI_5g23544v3 [Brachypodium distachyon]|uniref:Uncharacterized protein n=1 Tax=Brachypodium distachyon TaxID=15368 RepID=A0A0Q3EAM6_BRADI|nr:hypothetical protein BRADI_5g23544v3 [Brachypodium distachyon]